MFAILGPTASGKSALAMRLCREHGGEIVAADALMVYRGFDIGTNKPTDEERALVRHHLIDVHDWSEPMHAGAYAKLASAAIDDIRARGKTPVLVVGTYLYFRALVYGLIDAPPSDPQQRAEITALPDLAEQVRAVDPESFAEAGHGKNIPHLVRALEIFRATGERASDLRKRHAFAEARYAVDVTILSPDRDALNARIDARVHEMFDRGWIDEVRALRKIVPLDARPMLAVGYREIAAALEAGTPVDRADIAQKTRQYARRQRSFFKHQAGKVVNAFGC